ncbi:MAG TPA: hypothetical protein PKA55_15120 [Rhodoblastus sp.]|nr:hypothetical protein [Rhodoblastus sp.]
MTRPSLCMAICAAALLAAEPARADDQAAPAPGTIVLQPVAATAKIVRNGWVTVSAVLSAGAQLPNGATVNYNVSASVYDSSYTNSHTVSGAVTVAARKATITVRMPYSWIMASATDTMTVSLTVSASVPTSGPTYTFNSNFISTATVPANGATTALTYSGSL